MYLCAHVFLHFCFCRITLRADLIIIIERTMSLVLQFAQAKKVFAHANAHRYALPAVNVIGTNSINATLEAAKSVNSPTIIQFSNSGSAFFAGKSLDNHGQQASIVGAVAAAKYVHEVSDLYGM